MPAEHTSPVWFTRCADYGDASAVALKRLIGESGLLAADVVRGKHVLVKPNLLTDRAPDEAVTTHPDVLRSVLSQSGLGAVCREVGVPFVSFEGAGVQSFEVDGFSFTLAKPVVEADLIVNLPKVKSHSLTKLTAAVKNLYGAVPGYSKATLHRLYPKPAEFGRLLRAIWKVLPPAVSIADGIVGMEGQGPANGRPIRLGFLAASADPFALDGALCRVLHIRFDSVPYLKGVASARAPEVRGDAIDVPKFATPLGAHLLALVPTWFARLAAGLLWVRPMFDAARCVACGQCVRACPAQALALEGRTIPLLNKKTCIGCACCHEVCPKGAIRMKPSAVLRLSHAFKDLK